VHRARIQYREPSRAGRAVNYRLFKAINDLSGNHDLNSVMRFVAQDLIFALYVMLVAICVFRLAQREVRPVLLAAITLVLTLALGHLAGALHPEQRPFQTHHVHQIIGHANGQSFPSDHATKAFGIALITMAFLSRRWGVAMFLVAVLIGFARVYVGVHYPGDIAGGLLVALIAVGAVVLASEQLTSKPTHLQGRGS
jgi:undecaprenyl-diphosphatase